jgi:hypothetical protein
MGNAQVVEDLQAVRCRLVTADSRWYRLLLQGFETSDRPRQENRLVMSLLGVMTAKRRRQSLDTIVIVRFPQVLQRPVQQDVGAAPYHEPDGLEFDPWQSLVCQGQVQGDADIGCGIDKSPVKVKNDELRPHAVPALP